MKNNSLSSILITSMLSGILSVIVIFVFPVTVSVSEEGSTIGPSPYMVELQALNSKTSKGLHPDAPEWARMEELRNKNEKWFEDKLQKYPNPETISIREIVSKKSSKLAPFLIIFWGVSYYLIAKNSAYLPPLLILTLPLGLLLVQFYSLTAWIFSTLGVLIGYFVLVAKNRNKPVQS